ncbi:UNVERIFIED_CONTAM: hypothetical protein NCL1_35959 [Trichonephila clavipes]
MVCDAEDCGFQTLNNDEIVASVHRDSDPVDDETDEDEDNNSIERSKGPSNADAFSTLETAMEWYEQQSKFCSSQLLLLKRMRDLGAKKRRCTMVQRKIKDFACSFLFSLPIHPIPRGKRWHRGAANRRS